MNNKIREHSSCLSLTPVRAQPQNTSQKAFDATLFFAPSASSFVLFNRHFLSHSLTIAYSFSRNPPCSPPPIPLHNQPRIANYKSLTTAGFWDALGTTVYTIEHERMLLILAWLLALANVSTRHAAPTLWGALFNRLAREINRITDLARGFASPAPMLGGAD
jgi:hypothetical protein